MDSLLKNFIQDLQRRRKGSKMLQKILISAACRCPFKLCIVPVWVALLIKSSLNTQKKKKKKKTSIDALLQGFSCNWPRRLLVRELSMNLPGTHRTSYMHVGAKNTNITPSWNTPHILHACWS
uniref:Uncharacterized protein n=1 Tax=Populus trichocarpa TaxID=3694 RepID=B9HF31_POPTR